MSKSPDVNVSRWQQAMRFMFGFGGHFSPQIDGEIQAAVILENDRTEQRLARGEVECWGRGSAGAVVGQISQVGLVIPANSNMLVTVQAIIISIPSPLVSPAAMVIARQYTPGGVSGGAPGPITRDTRAGSSYVPAAIITQTAARVGTIAWVQPAALPSYVGPEIVMAPSETAGVAILVDNNTVNAAVDVSFCWRERPLESGFLS